MAIRKVSKKRMGEVRRYNKLRISFLDGKICPVTKRPATEVHHTNGRNGDRLLDEDYWLAVSREGHLWIHSNPKEARNKGWLI